jgi:flagellin-specific chaperone FliS
MIPPAYVRRVEEAGGGRRDRVVLVILEGGHACLVRARDALAGGDLAGFAADVCRTKDALHEAASAVDAAVEGGLAARIDALHDTMVGNLALASREGALERLDALLASFGPLLHACRAGVVPPAD